VLNQRREDGLVQRCEPYQARVQPLELTLRHRVEVDATNALLGTRALQPTEKDLGRMGIRDGALPQTTFDFCVGRRLPLTTRCATPRDRDERDSDLRGGTLSGLSPLARQGNAIVIEEASHDACLFPRIHGAEADKPRVQALELLYGEGFQSFVFRS
jgi:hypothetical protein